MPKDVQLSVYFDCLLMPAEVCLLHTHTREWAPHSTVVAAGAHYHTSTVTCLPSLPSCTAKRVQWLLLSSIHCGITLHAVSD